MAKKAYIGVNGVARKIKKGYVGVNGVARKIKKAYIGIGGVARPCWSSGGLSYYGKITDLSVKRYRLAATSVGKYALFGGGSLVSTVSKTATVDAYDSSLTLKSAPNLSQARDTLTATTASDTGLAVFAGGDAGSACVDILEVYTNSLTKLNPVDTLSESKNNLTSTSLTGIVLFAGGRDSVTLKEYGTVDAFNSSFTKQTVYYDLSTPRYNLSSTSVDDRYVFFGAGYECYDGTNHRYSNRIDVYNKSLVRYTTLYLSTARERPAATTIGDYAFFVGGDQGQPVDTVDVYDKSLTNIASVDPLIMARDELAATTIEQYAIFGAGAISGFDSSTGYFDIYDTSLTHTSQTVSSCYLNYAVATTIGNYAIFAGSSYPSAAPLAFTVA